VRAALDFGRQLAVDAGQHAFEHLARRHPAGGHAATQAGDLLLDAQRVRGHARQGLLDPLGTAHRRGRQQLGQLAVRPAQGAQAHRPPAGEGLLLDLALEVVDEDIERDLVHGRQPVSPDGARFRQHPLGHGVARGLGLGRHVGQPIGVAQVAAEDAPFRELARHVLPLPLEERVQGAGLVGVDRGGRGGDGGRRRHGLRPRRGGLAQQQRGGDGRCRQSEPAAQKGRSGRRRQCTGGGSRSGGRRARHRGAGRSGCETKPATVVFCPTTAAAPGGCGGVGGGGTVRAACGLAPCAGGWPGRGVGRVRTGSRAWARRTSLGRGSSGAVVRAR
jgi:hypothetical protein